jgi:hypothetical protein
MGAAVNPAYINGLTRTMLLAVFAESPAGIRSDELIVACLRTNQMVISFNDDPFRDGLCKMGQETVPRMLSKVSENLDGALQ